MKGDRAFPKPVETSHKAPAKGRGSTEEKIKFAS
jgi:hypothetical protein